MAKGKVVKRNMTCTRLRVRGSGGFPFDMLRYDNCFPDKEEDSAAVGADHVLPYREVWLRRVSLGTPANVDRWRSFGWEVVEEVSDWRLL